jgi:hypothetical protein
LMAGKNEFYIKSLENLNFLKEEELEIITISRPVNEIKSYLFDNGSDYFTEIIKISKEINIFNRKYFEYEIDYETYLLNLDNIFKDFKTFLTNNINYLPDLEKKFQFYSEKITENESINNKIINLQESVKYSLFFQKIEEFIHIYGEGKMCGFNNKNNNNNNNLISLDNINEDNDNINFEGIKQENLKMLLYFFFLIVNKNPQNLTLLMKIKANIFVNAFYEIKETLFDFMELIGEILFNEEYKFDNYYFYSEVLNEILEKLDFDAKKHNSKKIEVKYKINLF